MANKTIFASRSGRPNTVNNAGGRAYSLEDKHALAQLVVTGCLNDTYYTNATEQLDTILKLAGKCDVPFVAKAAVYGRVFGKMKDTPALLLAHLTSRGYEGVEYTKKIFNKVITNTKMLRNFFQIVRSGKVGRKNFGTAISRLMANWLSRNTMDELFDGSVGNNPTLGDVIKLSHVKPNNKARENFHNYLLGRKFNIEELPERIRNYENFKKGLTDVLPNVPFDFLTSLRRLTDEHWKEIARNAPFNMTRMNLNTFARHGVFKDDELTKLITDRLRSRENVAKFNVFPYSIMTSLNNIEGGVPSIIIDALQDAIDYSIENVPEFDEDVAVCLDCSGSMSSPITGYRKGSTSKVSCLDVASLIAASIARKNRNTIIIPFGTKVCLWHIGEFNPSDSVWTNSNKLRAIQGGGTNCSSALRYINEDMAGKKPNLVIYVSDNESWLDSGHYGRFGGSVTATMEEFRKLQSKSKDAKMVCIDLTPNTTTQAKENKDILNVGGWSDACWDVIGKWVKGGNDFVKTIEEIDLDSCPT